MDTVYRTEDVDAEAAAWAMSAAGREVLAGLVEDVDDDPLAVASRLRDMGLDGPRAAALQGIAAASRRAWDDGQPRSTWWTPAAAEQASDPRVARWRARRFTDQQVVDLTAGCGADALALVEVAGQIVAADLSPARIALLRANLHERASVLQADATAPCVEPSDWWAWADPGRRIGGRRVRGLGDTIPPVPALVAAGWQGLGVAVSPAVDLADPSRPADAELEFVQVGRRLVEATLWCGAARDTGPGERATASATLLPDGLHLRGEPSGPDGPVAEVGAWLAEPAPALVRARLADQVAASLGLARVARRRALFTGAAEVASPWFRVEAVEATAPARPGRVRDVLAGLAPLPVELVTHGMSVDVSAWWRGMGSPPRGPQGRAVHLVRLDRGSVAVVTRRAQPT